MRMRGLDGPVESARKLGSARVFVVKADAGALAAL